MVAVSLIDGFSNFQSATRVLNGQRVSELKHPRILRSIGSYGLFELMKAVVSRAPSEIFRVGEEAAVFSTLPGIVKVSVVV